MPNNVQIYCFVNIFIVPKSRGLNRIPTPSQFGAHPEDGVHLVPFCLTEDGQWVAPRQVEDVSVCVDRQPNSAVLEEPATSEMEVKTPHFYEMETRKNVNNV